MLKACVDECIVLGTKRKDAGGDADVKCQEPHPTEHWHHPIGGHTLERPIDSTEEQVSTAVGPPSQTCPVSLEDVAVGVAMVAAKLDAIYALLDGDVDSEPASDAEDEDVDGPDEDPTPQSVPWVATDSKDVEMSSADSLSVPNFRPFVPSSTLTDPTTSGIKQLRFSTHRYGTHSASAYRRRN